VAAASSSLPCSSTAPTRSRARTIPKEEDRN
jgi:hypothetical protein